MIIFTLSVNFVSGLGVFPTSYETGFVESDNTSETFENLTNIESQTDDSGNTILGLDALLIGLLGAGGIIAIVAAWVTRSPVILGVYAFSAVFWASYIRMLVILELDLFTSFDGFVGIGTAAMFFVFAGAIAGMLSGSG